MVHRKIINNSYFYNFKFVFNFSELGMIKTLYHNWKFIFNCTELGIIKSIILGQVILQVFRYSFCVFNLVLGLSTSKNMMYYFKIFFYNKYTELKLVCLGICLACITKEAIYILELSINITTNKSSPTFIYVLLLSKHWVRSWEYHLYREYKIFRAL